MWTTWAFLVTLYTVQVFHAASVSSASTLSNSTQTAQNKGLEPSAEQARAARQLQPPQNSSSKANDDVKATTAKPFDKSQASYILNFHHGTLATKVPVDKNDNLVTGWHTTIYRRVGNTYSQICGGSLVKRDTAISAAHCFWDDDGLMPAEQFAVAAGRGRRRWQDAGQYRSNISEIIVPPRFLGITTSYQDDIAVLRLASPVEYRFGVKPVCVDFDLDLERWHLSPGYHGVVTGFGLTEENGQPSEVLNYQRLPYVDIRACIAASDPSFLKYLTSDKICAGDQKTGRALCRGDSGGGLVFFFGKIETAIIYLRGVASTGPRNNNACNAYAIGSFTHLRTHRTFLRDNIPGLEEECKTFYANELASQYVLKPVKPANTTGSNEDSETYEVLKRPDNNGTQSVTSNSGLQLVTEAPVDANEMDRVTPNVDQTPNSNKPNETQDLTSIPTAERLPDILTYLHGPLNGAIKPSVSTPNGNNQEATTGILSEVKVRGNPNTNIFFFTGPVVDPNRVYSETGGTVVGNIRPEQPTNIYLIIQN